MYTFSGSSRTPVGATTGYSTSDPITGSIAVNPDRDTLIAALIINAGGAARTGGAPTFGGYTMLQVDTSQGGATSPEIRAEMWYITASGINSPTITGTDISVPNGNADRIALDLVSAYAGPGKTSILQASSGSANATTSTNPYCRITTTAGSNIIFEVVANGANSWAPSGKTAIFTTINNNDIGNYGGGMQYAITNTTGVITGSWTFATAEDWGVVMGAFGETNASIYLQNSSHLVTSSEVLLTAYEPAQSYTLAIQDSAHAQESVNVQLAQNYTLTVQNCSMLQVTTSVELLQDYLLLSGDAQHIQVSANVILTAYIPNWTLTVQSVVNIQTADNIQLAQHYIPLTLADVINTQVATNVALTAYAPSYNLTVNSPINLQISSSVNLTQHQVLSINSTVNLQIGDNVSLIQNYVITVQNIINLQTSGTIILIQHQVLFVDSVINLQTGTSVNLVQGGAVGVQSTVHAQTISALALTQHQILNANNSIHLLPCGTITLSQGTILTLVDNSIQLQTSQNVALIENYILVVLIATQLLISNNISLGAGGNIIPKVMHYIRLRSK